MMFEYLLISVGFGFAAGVQPGPLQAFVLSETLAHGWRRTLPAAFSPLLSDGPIAALTLLVLREVPETFQRGLRTAGGALLVYLGVRALLQWRRQREREPDAGGRAPRTLFRAALVNLLNPNPYLGWSLVLAPLVLNAWRAAGAPGAILIAGAFYATIVVTIAATILAFGILRKSAQPVVRVLHLVSAITLLALGVYQIGAGLLIPAWEEAR